MRRHLFLALACALLPAGAVTPSSARERDPLGNIAELESVDWVMKGRIVYKDALAD